MDIATALVAKLCANHSEEAELCSNLESCVGHLVHVLFGLRSAKDKEQHQEQVSTKRGLLWYS